MAYNTMNPVGSTDARDLLDNATNLDTAVNGSAARWTDRLGVSRPSWAGMVNYADRGAYAAGIVITGYNETFLFEGEFYRAAAITALPYTTTGSWSDDGNYFVSVGDAILRSELLNNPNDIIPVYNGMINVAYFGTLEAARTSSEAVGKTIVVTTELTEAQSNITAAWPTDRGLKVEKGGSINPTASFTGLRESYPEWFGENTTPGTTDMTNAMNKALAAIEPTGGTVYLSSTTYYCPNGINFYKTVSDSSHTWTIKGQGAKQSIIKTLNAKVSLDLGGRNRVVLKDMGIIDSGATAEVGIARYREESQGGDGGGGYHIYQNLYMEGLWSKAAIYSIAGEVHNHYNLQINQNGNGAGYFTASTNLLSATLAGTPRIGYTSNTNNNFYGGYIISASPTGSGGAVYFGSSAGQTNFYGTYLVGWNQAGGGYNVKFGDGVLDEFIESYSFINVRFEGQTDAITATAKRIEGLNITGAVFGQEPGQDIKFTNVSAGVGLDNAYIVGNYHKGAGMTIPVISRSTITVVGNTENPENIITINNGNVSGSTITAKTAITGTTLVYSSVITDNYTDGAFRTSYGPNSKTSAGNSQGSAIINKPFGAAPINPAIGQIVTAGVSNWEPTQTGTALDIPVFYNGTNWVAMVPVAATPTSATASGTKGTFAYDANYIYMCTATNTWRRIAYGAVW